MTDRAAALARELTEAALAGADSAALVGRVAVAAGVPCRLLGPDGAVLAASDGGPGLPGPLPETRGAAVVAPDGWAATALPFRVGAAVRRVLLVDARGGPDAVALAAAAETALLIDDLRRTERASPGDGAMRPADVLSALRHGPAGATTLAAAERAGLWGGVRSAAVLHHDGPRHRAWQTALSWLDHHVEVDGPHAWTLVRDRAELAALRRTLALTVGEERVTAASGVGTETAELLPTSFAEAGRLLAVARSRRVPLLAYEDAGVLQVLLTTPRARLDQYVSAALGPVLDKPELLQTLRAWLAESGSRQSVSEQLHLHRNSVGYRVRRLKDLLGIDPLEPAARTRLHVALTAWDLVCAEDGAEQVSSTV
jgi:hypothetical protein